MPDFKRLQELGAASPDLDYSQSGNPNADSGAMAQKVGLSPAAIEPADPPTIDSLRKDGYHVSDSGNQTMISTPNRGTAYMLPDVSEQVKAPDQSMLGANLDGTQPTQGGPSMLGANPDWSPKSQLGGSAQGPKNSPFIVPQGVNPDTTAPTSQQQFNQAANLAGQAGGFAAQGMAGAFSGAGGGAGMAAGGLGMMASLGVPGAAEAAAIAGKISEIQAAGGLDKFADSLSNPGAAMDNIMDIMALAGIKLPPALQAGIKAASDIAKAIPKAQPPPGGAPGVFAHGQQVARLGTSPTAHGTPLLPGPGALTVLVMGTPAWRLASDFHLCPLFNGPVPHGGGLTVPGGANKINVFAMGPPIAISTDQVIEPTGGPNPILPVGAAKGDEEKKKKEEEKEKKKKEQEEKEKKEKQEAEQKKAEKEKAAKEKAAKDKAKVEKSEGLVPSESEINEDLKAQRKALDNRISELDKPIEKMSDQEKKRFETYFGPLDDKKKDKVLSNLKQVKSQSEKTTYKDFKPAQPSDPNTYAYVLKPDASNDIYLDQMYRKAPANGFDSRHGTLTHEMSHKIVDTKDHIYGNQGAKKYATESPDLALENADNYQYYTEAE